MGSSFIHWWVFLFLPSPPSEENFPTILYSANSPLRGQRLAVLSSCSMNECLPGGAPSKQEVWVSPGGWWAGIWVLCGIQSTSENAFSGISLDSVGPTWGKGTLLVFPGDLHDKESACNAGDLGWKNPLEKRMATHSGILAWRIPWTEEPGSLQYMDSQRVRHDWVTNTFRFQMGKVLGLCTPEWARQAGGGDGWAGGVQTC